MLSSIYNDDGLRGAAVKAIRDAFEHLTSEGSKSNFQQFRIPSKQEPVQLRNLEAISFR